MIVNWNLIFKAIRNPTYPLQYGRHSDYSFSKLELKGEFHARVEISIIIQSVVVTSTSRFLRTKLMVGITRGIFVIT